MRAIDIATIATWFIFGGIGGWCLAVMMGEIRKSETNIHHQVRTAISADACHAIARAVVAVMREDVPVPSDETEQEGE
jgi:DNA-binding transcriptional regulator YdaS (Cro superfamily)